MIRQIRSYEFSRRNNFEKMMLRHDVTLCQAVPAAGVQRYDILMPFSLHRRNLRSDSMLYTQARVGHVPRKLECKAAE
jgi:hypothetical protein